MCLLNESVVEANDLKLGRYLHVKDAKEVYVWVKKENNYPHDEQLCWYMTFKEVKEQRYEDNDRNTDFVFTVHLYEHII